MVESNTRILFDDSKLDDELESIRGETRRMMLSIIGPEGLRPPLAPSQFEHYSHRITINNIAPWGINTPSKAKFTL